MDEARAAIFETAGTLRSASGAGGGALRENELTLYPDDGDLHDWKFAEMPLDSHVSSCASVGRDLETVRWLCGSGNVEVPEDAEMSSVWHLPLQNLEAVTHGDPIDSAKPVALECMHLVEETGAASLACCTIEKIDMIREQG